jgi:transposase InsO family protein
VKTINELKVASNQYTIKELCETFEVNQSTYYDRVKEKPIAKEKEKILRLIKSTAIQTRHTYGRRRMKQQLKLEGIDIGIYKTASMMKEANVVAIKPKKRHYYPNGGICDRKIDNVLDRQFNQAKTNTHWVGDITYIRNHQGWSYLACVLDLGSKEIVGWALSKHPDAQLAKRALSNAISRKQPDTSGLLFHSDQGTQYTANMFAVYCENLKITRSMSRRGNCWDNAVMERFFRNLKTERLNHLRFINHEAVIAEVESYIYFYNYKRLNSAIDYLTPNQKFNELRKCG